MVLTLSPSLIAYYNKFFDYYRTQRISLVYTDIDVIQQALSQNCEPISILKLYVNKNDICIIKDSVRKIILDWALKCEKLGVKGENWIFKKEDKKMASNITNYINCFSGNTGQTVIAHKNIDTTINQSSQSISITKGDFSSLASFLIKKGINEPDIQELNDIIDIEPNLATEAIKNNKIQGWIGKIATKMATGALTVASGVTVEVIVKALEQFF